MSSYQVAVFGAGRIGNVHGPNVNNHARSSVKYVVDPADGPASDLASKLGATTVDAEEALRDPDIAAIVVGSHTSTHADLIEQGIGAGKAVFCEKPIDLDIKRVRQVLDEIEGANAPLFLAFNRRFDPGVAAARQRAASGVIGDIELVTVISKDPDGGLPIEYLETSGGMFRDMTIHDFDMARFLLGEEPATVSATAATLVSPEIAAIGDIDTAAISMQTESGKIAVITNSRRCSTGYDQRVEIHGSTGMARTDNVPRSMVSIETANGVERANPKFFFTDRYAESYAAEWEHFIDVLDGRARPDPTGIDGYRALLLAEAAYASLETGRTVNVAEVEKDLFS